MINSDDPRVTAYVLGELNEADCNEIEAAIAASPELQAEVDAIRNATELFGTSLQATDSPALTDGQRVAIEEPSANSPIALAFRSGGHQRRNRRRYAMAAAVAGLIALIVTPFIAREVRMVSEIPENRSKDWFGDVIAGESQPTASLYRSQAAIRTSSV